MNYELLSELWIGNESSLFVNLFALQLAFHPNQKIKVVKDQFIINNSKFPLPVPGPVFFFLFVDPAQDAFLDFIEHFAPTFHGFSR
jgi:hypothetical protein